MKKDELIFEGIRDLDVLFLRKNRPLNYQAIEFLALESDRVFMINSIDRQILGNSKFYLLNFPDIIPVTYVSRDLKRLRKIIDDFGGAMVVKPLHQLAEKVLLKKATRRQKI